MRMEREGKFRCWPTSPNSFETGSLVKAGFHPSDFLGCSCLCFPSVCSFGVIDAAMSGFLWVLGVPLTFSYAGDRCFTG